MPMTTRRNLLQAGSALSLFGVAACNPAAAPMLAAGATTGVAVASGDGLIAAIATQASALADVAFGVAYAGGILAGKPVRALLQGLDASSRVAKGLETASKRAQSQSSQVQAAAVQPKDSLLPAKTAKEQLTYTVEFKAPPILPGRSEPESVYWLVPVVWTKDGPRYGQPFQLTDDRIVAAHTIYGPGLRDEHLLIATPGVYRTGYQLKSQDEQRTGYAGSAILHVFADEVWSYEQVLADTDGAARDPTVSYSAAYLDPYDDPELMTRYSE